MSVSRLVPVGILVGLLLPDLSFGSGLEQLVWGENVGFVKAYVDRIDNEKGLTVHPTPSAESPVLIHLPLGTKVQGANEFQHGWVKLKGPAVPAWIDLQFLRPMPFEGMVTKVDNKELCLPIRAGPTLSHEKVACAQIGESLNLTGIATADNWLQLTDRRGWVDASSVQLPQEVPQAVAANTEAPSAAPSVAPAENSPRDETAMTHPQLGSPAAEKFESEKMPSAPPFASPSSTQITAPPDKPASKENELAAVLCEQGWCVNFDNSMVTHDSKVVSGIECFKNDACANIVAKHHSAEANTKGLMTFGNFRLLAGGVILDSESGKVLVNCHGKGGVGHKCVADFLRKTVASTNKENKGGAVSQKAVKPTAKFNKPATAASAHRTPKKESSERPFSSPFFDQEKSEQQMNENAWEDANKRLP